VSDVRPSHVRARALHEYEAMRRTIDELDGIATRLLAEGTQAVDEALTVTAKLLRELSEYVDLQQLFVLPTVRRVDIWGDIRADALATDHEARRDDLGAIERAHPRPVDPRSLASDLREFSRTLREDLKREEQDVLGAGALRDDVVDTEPD
jgi:hypothetical protein